MTIKIVVLLKLSIFFSALNNILNDSESSMSGVNFYDINISISAVASSEFYFPPCKCTNSYVH